MPLVALIVAIVATAALAACGGSDSTDGTESTAKVETSQAKATPGSGENEGKQSSGGSGSGEGRDADGSGADVDAAPLKVSGGGSAQFRVKGGDNSVQEFGEESDESELEEAGAALHGFFVARAEEDWATACSFLSKGVQTQFEALGSRSGQLDGKGCAGVLAAITPPLPATVRREQTIVDAASLRHEDDNAFLIYRGAEGTSFVMPMDQEDGAWKVGAIGAAPL